MTALGWSAPATSIDAQTARDSILRQHEEIRSLLERARRVADATLDGFAASADALVSVIGDIRASVEVHLVFEERVLLEILREDFLRGPERALYLLDDHRRQRALLAKLHREATAHPELPTLAAKVAFMTSCLMEDMAHEELGLGALDAPCGRPHPSR
jgi:hypothetical protein